MKAQFLLSLSVAVFYAASHQTKAAVVTDPDEIKQTTPESLPETQETTVKPATTTKKPSRQASASGQQRCVKQLVEEVDFGTCGSLTRFFYNATSKRCTKFSGCYLRSATNTNNNFDSEAQCSRTCIESVRNGAVLPTTTTARPTRSKTAQSTTTLMPRCQLTVANGIDFGNCPGIQTTRYYYSYQTALCMPFKGCVNSRGNNWRSKADCQLNCNRTIAALPTTTVKAARCGTELTENVDFGECGSAERWKYSSQLRKCVLFLGCENSDTAVNNFASQNECQQACMSANENY